MKKQFIVSVNIPNGVSIKEMEDYIREAVRAYKGCFSPDSLLYDLKQHKAILRGGLLRCCFRNTFKIIYLDK